MKALPEKLVMAAVILSCGLVAHSDPLPRDGKPLHAGSSSIRSPHALARAGADQPSHLLVKVGPGRSHAP